MKIAMILDAKFPPDPRVENEAVTLVNAGHQVFLFCLTYTKEKQEEIINGIHIVRYPSNQLEYKLSALAYTVPFYTILIQQKIHHFFNKVQPEAIHIHDIKVAEAVFKANKKLNLPVVLDLHDNYPEVMKLYPHLQKFPGKYIISPNKWKEKEKELILKSDKIISVSPHFIKDLITRIPKQKENFVLVPNTIRKSFFKDYKVDESIINKYANYFVILYLGDTHIRRGLQTAIESINNLKNEISNIKLVIVGKNTTDVILKQQVKDLALEHYVDFEGWQDVSLFQSYILASHICISPLHRNLQHDVAYANKIFQYMSFGKPLLVSNATAQKELIEENNSGLVHEDRNVVDFSDKLLKLYHDEDLREKLGENGKQFVRNTFCWEQTSKNLLHLYDTILD